MTTPQAIHPGEHLAEFLEELDITQYRLAKTIGVPQVRISDIVHCRRAITADTALRIGRALGTTPEFWLNLQRMYDLDTRPKRRPISKTSCHSSMPRDDLPFRFSRLKAIGGRRTASFRQASLRCRCPRWARNGSPCAIHSSQTIQR